MVTFVYCYDGHLYLNRDGCLVGDLGGALLHTMYLGEDGRPAFDRALPTANELNEAVRGASRYSPDRDARWE